MIADYYALIASQFPLMAGTSTVELVMLVRNLSTARNFLNFILGTTRVWHRLSHSCLLVGLIALNASVGHAQEFDARNLAVDSHSVSRFTANHPDTASDTTDPTPDSDDRVDSLPETPLPQQPNPPLAAQNPPSPPPGPLGSVPPAYTRAPLTLHDKWTFYIHGAFGPPSLVSPAFGAALRMASPPDNYPREWRDGAEAFGRLYGDAYAQQVSKHTVEFAAEVLLHEDPRYRFAPHGTGALHRVVHALAFTVVDRTDSGRPTLAVANFAGAAASGFIGRGYLPDGFNDVTHAGQRATLQLGLTAGANIAREFAPEWYPFVKKLHLPKLLPAWWVPEHKTKP